MNKNFFLHVSSAQRISGTNSNFEFRINQNIMKNYDYVAIQQLLLPKSYYNVSAHVIVINENALTYDIDIPQGYYTISQFCYKVQTLINLQTVLPITVVYDTILGKIIFTNTVLNMSFQTDSYLYYGFTSSSSYLFVSNQLKSEQIPNLQQNNEIQILSNIIQNRIQNAGENMDNMQYFMLNNVVNQAFYIFEQDPHLYLKPINQNNDTYYIKVVKSTNSQTDIDFNGQEMHVTFYLQKKKRNYLKMIYNSLFDMFSFIVRRQPLRGSSLTVL